MSKNNAFDQIVPKYKIWLETPDGKGIMGDGKWILFKTIQEEGSLMAAVKKLGLSYRTTWNNLKKIEERLDVKLFQHTRGGSKGGDTTFTEEGLKIINAFDNFHTKLDRLMEQALKDLKKELVS
jgi:molybdate transport repressor ModE-like protein